MQICTLDVVFQPFCGKPEVLKVHMHLMSYTTVVLTLFIKGTCKQGSLHLG